MDCADAGGGVIGASSAVANGVDFEEVAVGALATAVVVGVGGGNALGTNCGAGALGAS